jgi:protein phosphatase-4 regulatory subunit 3
VVQRVSVRTPTTHTTSTATDIASTVDDALSDDLDPVHSFNLPTPELGNLAEIENGMRMANSTAAGRDALAKFAVQQDYVTKLVPLVEMAEDLESLGDLHRLCNIMKTLILLNDSAIIEYAVTDAVVLGVVGALECELARGGAYWGGG